MSVVDKPITELEEPEVLDEVDQVLLDARQYMKEHGWCPRISDDEGRVCLIVAVSRAMIGNGFNSNLLYGAVSRLYEVLGCDSVPIWNDHFCKSEEEALAVFQKAINLPKQ